MAIIVQNINLDIIVDPIEKCGADSLGGSVWSCEINYN